VKTERGHSAALGESARRADGFLAEVPSIDSVSKTELALIERGQGVPQELREFSGVPTPESLGDAGFHTAGCFEELTPELQISIRLRRSTREAVGLELEFVRELERDQLLNSLDTHNCRAEQTAFPEEITRTPCDLRR